MGYKRSDVPSGGGTFLKAQSFSDVFGDVRQPRLTVAGVDLKDFKDRGDGTERKKLVLSFKEIEEELPLNVSNSDTMFEDLADDTDDWIGKQIVLKVGSTKMGPGIKLKVPGDQPEGAPSPAPAADASDDDDDEWDD